MIKKILMLGLVISSGIIGYKYFMGERKGIDYYSSLPYQEIMKIPKRDRPDLAAMFDYKITADPKLGYPPKERLLDAKVQAKKYFQDKKSARGPIDNVEWSERGPNNVAGRTRAIMFDPNDESNKKVWAGSVSGGLWYNEDITSSTSEWNAYDDFLPNLAISSITYDPNNTSVFYVGTGEGWSSNDTFVRGVGIWKSVDGGLNWSIIESMSDGFEFIQKVVVTDESTVLAAVKSNSANSGIWRSTDGGDSWDKVVSSSGADIEISGDKIYASTLNGSMYFSNDDGVTWSDVTPADVSGRIEIGVAKGFDNIVYAVGNEGVDAAWVYKSLDAGTSWIEVSVPTYYTTDCVIDSDNVFTRGQGWYDLILAVSPDNPNIIILGGIDLYRSDDAGSSWTLISYWTGACEDYVHADQHNFLFDPNNPDHAISSNDGGVFYTENIAQSFSDGGPSFESRNVNYNVTQYYACSMANEPLSNIMLAGAQDNGSHLFSSYDINSAIEVTGGDGAYCFIDQDDPDIMITSYVYNNYYVSTNGMIDFTTFGIGDESGQFINPSEYDTRTKTLFAGANADEINIYSSLFETPISEETVSIDLGGGAISHIALTSSTDKLFVGTYSGLVYVINDVLGDSPTATLLNSFLGSVSCISVGQDDDQLLVTLSNYGVVSVHETRDGGDTWADKEGNLPDMPIRWALYNPINTDQALLATESGVWSIDDITVEDLEWEPSNEGLANVPCYMLRYRDADGLIAVATHGRGIFTSDIFVTAPLADFYTNISTGYIDEEISFNNASLKSTTYVWDFGDGMSSSEENPTHIFEDAGTYEVSLTIDGDEENVISKSVVVLPKLDVDFELADGGDFETNEDYFVAVTIAGTGFELGSSLFEGKSGTQSGSNAWVTGLADETYVSWTEAYLYTPAYDFSLSGNYEMSFYTQYAIEDEWEGFIVEYTVDGGETWEKLGSELDEENWYNQIATSEAIVVDPGKPLFSGDTEGIFVKKSIEMNFLSNSESVGFRFVFRSDPAAEEAGIAIDDFSITGPTNTTPLVSFTSSDVGVCTGNTIEIINNSSGAIGSYTWDFGEGANPGTGEGYGPFDVTYSTIGEKTIIMTAQHDDGELTESIDITVANPPSESVVTGTSSICIGDNVSIVVETSELGVNYQLINLLDNENLEGDGVEGNGGLITLVSEPLTKSSLFRVVATNSAGCSINLSTAIQVEGKNKPEVSISSKLSGALEASFLGADEYIWLLNDQVIDGASEQRYTPVLDGTYKVQVPNGNCIGESDPFEYLLLSSDNDLVGIQIFPNPVTSKLQITGLSSAEDLVITDVIGHQLSVKISVDRSKLYIDFNDVSDGVYILSMNINGKAVSRQIVKR